MSNITTTTELSKSIQILIDKQEFNKRVLKEQLTETYEIFKPVNLIRNVLKKFTSSSFLFEKLIGPALGLATGYFLRK